MADFKDVFPRPLEQTHSSNKDNLSIEVTRDPRDLNDQQRQWLADSMVSITEPGVTNREAILKQMSAGTYNLYFCVDDQGSMAAYATVFPNKDNTCYLNKVQTRPDLRGQGIATGIIQQVMSDYRAIVLINVVHDPAVQQAMSQTYQRLGFSSDNGLTYQWVKTET